LTLRIIPTLLINSSRAVKTVEFKEQYYLGDPVNIAQIFSKKCVDELYVIDISASKNKQGPNFDLVEMICEECTMPVIYGGGIKTIEAASRLINSGVEKLSLGLSSLKEKDFCTELVGRFGSQSVVACLDVTRNSKNSTVIYEAAHFVESKETDFLQLVKSCESWGGGEIALNMVHREGTRFGQDQEIIRAVRGEISRPVIAIGGIGSLKHIQESFESGASAVGVGTFFSLYGPHNAVLISYPTLKERKNFLL